MSGWIYDWLGDLDPGTPGGDPDPPPDDPGPPPESGPAEPPQDPGPPPESEPPDPVKVTIERWVTEHDGKVCPICGPLDGTEWDAGDGPYPPAHINCRCRRIPVGYELRSGPPTDRPGQYIAVNPWSRADW